MRRAVVALVFTGLLMAGVAHAGTEVLHGPIFGVLPAGTECTIGDYAYVPVNTVLLVEEGVHIIFLTEDSLDVFGDLDAMGTPDQPVLVSAPDNWGGFYFSGGGSRVDTLRHVLIEQPGGVPRYVVRSRGQSLVIQKCDFVGEKSCLEVFGAHLWATDNSFLTRGLFSRTVKIDSLIPVIDFPPGTAPQNCLRSSNLRAEVPSVPVSPFEWRFTAALEVRSSNETVIRDNMFSVVAPGYVCGVYFGESQAMSGIGATIEHCVVAVRSHNIQARGIVNASESDLEIVRGTIDVGGGAYLPIGVSTSNRGQSYINSCDLVLTTGAHFFRAEMGANITAMYSDIWGAAPALAMPEPPGPFDGEVSGEGGVQLGDGMFSEDPQFVRGCEWGEWKSLEAVRAYYSLLPTSPCIDRGDIGLSLDPDDTRADVGCYYFPQVPPSSAPEWPVESAPASLLLAPYPNPFNSAAVIPFTVQHEGMVRVTVFDVLGRPVSELAAGRFSAGRHSVSIQAQGWATGLYFVAMDFDGVRTSTRKLLLVR
jgi:hypothetical protein